MKERNAIPDTHGLRNTGKIHATGDHGERPVRPSQKYVAGTEAYSAN